MQIGIFVVSVIVSLTASTLLVIRLERVGERIGVSEALLGLMAALAADGPEITSAATAMSAGHGTIGVGVTLGSNIFNLAALLGLSALVAGRIGLHRRAILLEGVLGALLALIAIGVVGGLVGPAAGLVLALVAFIPYLLYSAVPAIRRPRLSLPPRLSAWLAGALAEEELELAEAIRPRRGDTTDLAVAIGALVTVVIASVLMEQSASTMGATAGISPIIIGGLVLAAVTSLPNAVAAVYLASRGRGAAVLSTAFNSNAINVIVGFLVPAAILGLATSSDALLVAGSYLGLTVIAVVLAFRARGLDRRSGSVVIAAYVLFLVALVTR
ncbi:MAG: sodium:calcium antiporter [Candidatus Limnocylindrales bacterium]